MRKTTKAGTKAIAPDCRKSAAHTIYAAVMELVNDEANILTSFAYGENSILRIFMRGNRKKATTYFAGSANLKACLMMAGPNAVQEAEKGTMLYTKNTPIDF